MSKIDEKRMRLALKLGLSSDATWEDCAVCVRRDLAKQKGLSQEASWQEIGIEDAKYVYNLFATPFGFTQAEEDRIRQKRLKRSEYADLPKDATWDQIFTHDCERERLSLVKQLGLPDNATWDEAIVADLKKMRNRW